VLPVLAGWGAGGVVLRKPNRVYGRTLRQARPQAEAQARAVRAVAHWGSWGGLLRREEHERMARRPGLLPQRRAGGAASEATTEGRGKSMTFLRWVAGEIRWKRNHGREAGCSWLHLLWSMAWWPGEDHPKWLTRAIFILRRAWYRSREQTCVCPGCTHRFPAWWATDLCKCCGYDEECCHDEEE
jgi:hypothetical protein